MSDSANLVHHSQTLEMYNHLQFFIHRRLRKAFKVSMPALGEGGWAETQFEDCTLEEMWTKMCRWDYKGGD